MSEIDYFSKPFFENASNGLLNYLFQDDGVSSDIPMYDPYQTSALSFDGDYYTDASSVSTQRTGELLPAAFAPIYSCGISYKNEPEYQPLSTSDYELPDILSQNAIATNQPDSFDLSLQPSTDETIGMTNYPEVRTDSVPVSRPLPSISSRGSLRTKVSEGLDKRSRIFINDISNKVTVLTETTKKIRYLESAVKELRQKVREVEVLFFCVKTRRALSEICYKPVKSTVNYHVMFLQNPIPQAILAADGQFIDANSQFCSLTRKTVQQLREMTLFKFAHPDDLPCAFGSYSSMLRGDTNSPGVCMLRHCCLGDCYQPVFFSLSLVRDDHNSPSFFVCNILPVLACTCTDSNNEECGIVLVHDCSRQCSGLLKGQNNRLYQICNPSEIFPWCAQLVDTNTGIPVSSATTL
ncbi:hypothetical protein JH06_0180 [Blastocystis sp. subtype 4]|uniref:hypothetical protein n=1 Tax=Blastocystis sp. subtype 4 TaxID=944170 RepID=UPI0007119ED8|nr:hypothetical protein JH06_0180 [Blastocystis sp. subtype 4]KNB46403.1 hypothetical protein JH06_0180 [Blastocystis sp. subtype 4]|eukprot:XP_014529846.1 hypothetical protein JH06_0180 [Blastocystis sp. subtype 4]